MSEIKRIIGSEIDRGDLDLEDISARALEGKKE